MPAFALDLYHMSRLSEECIVLRNAGTTLVVGGAQLQCRYPPNVVNYCSEQGYPSDLAFIRSAARAINTADILYSRSLPPGGCVRIGV